MVSLHSLFNFAASAAAKSLQSCLTLCDPIDGSPPGSPIPGILQARTLEWVAISSPMHESEKWEWSRSVVSDPQRPHGLQPTRLLRPWDFPGKSTGVGCHCLLHLTLRLLQKCFSETTQRCLPLLFDLCPISLHTVLKLYAFVICKTVVWEKRLSFFIVRL